MAESSFKFNKDFSTYFMNFNSENKIKLEDKEYNRFTPYFSLFDENKDDSLDLKEIRSIWLNVAQECKSDGDELILDEQIAENIIKKFDNEGKFNNGEFINFFKEILAKVTGVTHFNTGAIMIKNENNVTHEYYKSGALENVYDDNSKISYYANGNIAVRLNKDGSKEEFYASGKIYKKMLPDKSYTAYYESGNLKSKRNENESIQYYESGNIKSKINNRGNKFTHYYENGQIEESTEIESFYYVSYYPNGNIKTALSDSSDSEFKYYDEFGNEIKNEINNKPAENIKLDELIKQEPFDFNAFKALIKKNTILDVYEQQRDLIKELESKIQDENNKNEVISYIESLLSEIYNENLKNFPKKSRVVNSYHEGCEYDIQWDNGKINIENLDTKQKTTIDTERLVKNLPKDKQYLLLIKLQELPAEVLADIGAEATFSDIRMNMGGDYRYFTDTIQLVGNNFEKGTIVHELGHAIDNLFISSVFSTEQNNLLLTTFKEEKMVNEVSAQESNSYYAATNITEFFAESYALLMLGEEYRAKECIENNFPKSFEIVKGMIEKIRQLPPDIRHRQDFNN